MGLFSKLFDPNAGEIKRLQKIVDKIDSFEEAHKKLTDSELRAKTEEFKKRHQNGETLDQYMQGALPKIDMIIIQMDGDVFRKEREVHCACYADECASFGEEFPLNCKVKDCPVVIPCNRHEAGINSCVEYLKNLLLSHFPGEYVPICVIPCDSTDAWIVAAFDDLENTESIADPWTNIISRKKDYHGIRVPGHKKTKAVYDKLIPVVCRNWEFVKNRCSQASCFDQAISALQ